MVPTPSPAGVTGRQPHSRHLTSRDERHAAGVTGARQRRKPHAVPTSYKEEKCPFCVEPLGVLRSVGPALFKMPSVISGACSTSYPCLDRLKTVASTRDQPWLTLRTEFLC